MTKMAANWLKSIPNLRPKRLKNHSLWAAHTYRAHIREYPPPRGFQQTRTKIFTLAFTVMCRSLVQTHSYGSCLQSIFFIPNDIRLPIKTEPICNDWNLSTTAIASHANVLSLVTRSKPRNVCVGGCRCNQNLAVPTVNIPKPRSSIGVRYVNFDIILEARLKFLYEFRLSLSINLCRLCHAVLIS